MIVYVNGERRSVEPASSVLQVLGAATAEPPARGVAVAVDGSVVPRAQLAETVLHDGAVVEIVRAVQGG